MSLALSLALALTGFQMSVARGQPLPAGQVVICSGLGLVTVMVDSNGDPVGRTHVCPDGLLTLFNGLREAWIAPPRDLRWQAVTMPGHTLRGEGRGLPAVRARDPPVAA